MIKKQRSLVSKNSNSLNSMIKRSSMNKTLTIIVITLVAVIMGIGTITPVFAHDVTETNKNPTGICAPFFALLVTTLGEHPDHNFNGQICSLYYNVDGKDRHWILDDLIIPYL